MELTDTTTDQTSISVMPAIFNGPCQQEVREETEKEVQKVVVLMIRCTSFAKVGNRQGFQVRGLALVQAPRPQRSDDDHVLSFDT